MSSMHSNQLSYASATVIIISYFIGECNSFFKKRLKFFLFHIIMYFIDFIFAEDYLEASFEIYEGLWEGIGSGAHL